MKKKNWTWAMIMAASGLLLFKPLFAENLELRPRVETGLVNYSFQIGACSLSVSPEYGEATAKNEAQDKLELSDNMGYIGGGVTLFSGRWFVDLSARTLFDGNDITGARHSRYVEQSQMLETNDAEYSGQFDHQGQAVSVGYALGQRLSVYAGYKWAEANVEMTFAGPWSLLDVSDNATHVGEGQFFGEDRITFNYEGPFIGVIHGWSFDQEGFFKGLASVNLGLAYLTSDLQLERTYTRQMLRSDGQDLSEPISDTGTVTETSEGDTLGITVGLNWNGLTPIKGLTYSVGISGYRYQFDSDDDVQSGIRETTVDMKIGLAYLF